MGAVNAAGEFVYPMEYTLVQQINESDCYLIGKNTKQGELRYAIGDSEGNLLVGFEIVTYFWYPDDPVFAYSDEPWRKNRERRVYIFDLETKQVLIDSKDFAL